MEEMNNVIENEAVEIVEGVTEKLTFKENLGAYALAGTFVIGVATIGYLSYKGGEALANKIRNKKVKVEVPEQESVVGVEENDIHDVNDDESDNK